MASVFLLAKSDNPTTRVRRVCWLHSIHGHEAFFQVVWFWWLTKWNSLNWAGGTAAAINTHLQPGPCAALFMNLRSVLILALRQCWLSTTAGTRRGPQKHNWTVSMTDSKIKLCVGRETWGGSSTTNGEVWSETSGKLLVLLEGNWIVKLAVAKFHSVDSCENRSLF